MRMSRIPAMVIAALLLSRAMSHAAAPQWVKLTSTNFELYTSAGEKKGREAILYFEQVRNFFLQALSIKDIPTNRPVRIVAFSSEKEYLPYKFNEVAAAYYVSDGRHDVIVMPGITPESYHVSVHEFTHLIIGHSNLKLPVWLNEGLAEVYSTLRPVAKKVQIGDILPGRILELRDAKWIDLDTLTSAGHDSPYYNEKKRAGVFYAESWALTHMLVLSPDYAQCKPRLVPMLMEGKPAAASFQEICGKSTVAVQKDLVQYVNGSRFFVGLFPIQLEKRAEAPDVAAVDPLESGIVLADVLMLVHKRSEARTRLESLAKEHPKSWQIEAELGELDWRDRHADDARKHFARAVELGCTDAQMFLDYASLERGKASLLRKAVELKPDWQEAQYRLGLALMNEGEFEQAIQRLRAIKKVTPDQAFSYFYALAYGSYRLGKKPEAAKFVEQARKWAKQPGDAARLDDLAGYLEARQPARGEAALPRVQEPESRSRDERPQLARRADDPPPPPTPMRKPEIVEGALRQIDCLGSNARVIVDSGGKQMRLAIMDPNRIVVRNSKAGAAEFTCGPQKSQPVLLEYESKSNPDLGTSGEIRAIEFK